MYEYEYAGFASVTRHLRMYELRYSDGIEIIPRSINIPYEPRNLCHSTRGHSKEAMSSPHKLALPAQAGPSGSSAQTKKRKRFKVTTNSATKASKIDFDRALDEGDDVSDTELEAPPLTGAGRRYGGRYEDEDYDEDAGVERDSGGEEGEGEDGEKKRDRDRHKRRRGDNTGSKSVEEDLGRKNKRMRGDQL